MDLWYRIAMFFEEWDGEDITKTMSLSVDDLRYINSLRIKLSSQKIDKKIIRAKAIDEFAELLKGNLIRKYANANLTQQYVALQVTDWCNEIAEQLKAGGKI